MAEKFKTFAPLFPGFYNTVFEYNGEEGDIESYNEENGTDLNYDDFTFDYSGYNNRVARSFTGRLETELREFLPISINFERVHSPREYNFENDSIYVEVELNLEDLLKAVAERKEEAAEYFREKYTSCSGFISFHSPNVENWLNEEYIREKESHRVGALLDCLCSIEIDQDDIMYWTDSESWIDFWPQNDENSEEAIA